MQQEGVRHPKFYLHDGDLVIRSMGDGAPVDSPTLFRVHRGILSYNSPVFSSMFTLPNNANSQEMFDGVPVVSVFDNAEDFAELLRALYEPGYVVAHLYPGTYYEHGHCCANVDPSFSRIWILIIRSCLRE